MRRAENEGKGIDIDLMLMVLFLVVIMVFDRTTEPNKFVSNEPVVQEQVIVAEETKEEIIEGVEIENPNLATNKEEEIIYIYEIGDIVDITIDGETVHFVVADITEELAQLKEIGVRDGREVVINNLKQ